MLTIITEDKAKRANPKFYKELAKAKKGEDKRQKAAEKGVKTPVPKSAEPVKETLAQILIESEGYRVADAQDMGIHRDSRLGKGVA